MSQFTLSIFDSNFLLPHRAGVAGLALALSELESQRDQAPLKWKITNEAVELEWEGSDQAVVKWLLDQTYRINNQGYLEVPALKLDEQGQYTFTQGLLSTFLQHSQQRELDSASVTRTFLIDPDQPEIQIDVKPLLSCYYTREMKDAFNNKGAFKKEIALKGNHLPGLVECSVNGPYQESPEGFLALLFLPLACSYYELPLQRFKDKLKGRSALVIPNIQNLTHWVNSRRAMPGRTYRDFRSSGAGESALHFLLQEKVVEEVQQFRVNYCEVYQLGKQAWDEKQDYLKQAVYRVQVTDEVLHLYEVARQVFSPRVRQNENGKNWLDDSRALPWICDNLIAGKPWYAGFFEFRKRNGVYERKGLVTMTEYLDSKEQVLFDVVQGAFSKYLYGQIQQAKKQGRPLDYGQVTDKVIYRFQRPSTQQEFATALVDFLSQFRSKAARDKGPQIFHWVHREENWRRARDLVLLAIATYTSKKGDDLGGVEVPIESSAEPEGDGAEMFSMSV